MKIENSVIKLVSQNTYIKLTETKEALKIYGGTKDLKNIDLTGKGKVT